MKKRKREVFGRAGVSELVSIFKRMREDASGELSPRAFLRRMRASLDDPETRAVLLKSLEAYVAGDWPGYVSGADERLWRDGWGSTRSAPRMIGRPR